MQSHGPKRFYTPHSLEYWFEKLADDWAGAGISPQASSTAQGRIYLDGEIRELELTNRDAIIHRRIEKKDEYAVVEWSDPEGLSVRSSTTDREVAHALAVAGMHEIEELVADEIPPLPGDPESSPCLHGKGAKRRQGLTGRESTSAPRAMETPGRLPAPPVVSGCVRGWKSVR